jgi:hypothetical protein
VIANNNVNTNHEATRSPLWATSAALIGALALAKFAAHLLTAGNYGYFRDELYYIAASKRLDLGYVDFPLLIAWATAAIRVTLGESLLALHIVPAAVGALVVLLAAQMAKAMGGGAWAQFCAALAVLAAPVFLAAHSLLTMDAFDELWWSLAILAALKALRRDEPRYWLWFGLFAGLGLLTKLTMLYLGAALAFALLLTGARRHLASRWLWLGGLLAAAMLLPYLVWQFQHDFATVDFWRTYAAGKTYPVTPVEFLLQQIFIMNVPGFLLAIAGAAALFFWKPLRPYRAFGWIYVILFAVFAVQQAKHYFLAGAYPVCFAAGAVLLEHWSRKAGRAWLAPAYAGVLAVSGVLLAPAALPVLPPDALGPYQVIFGQGPGVRTERNQGGSLPQYFADRFGWPELAESVGAVYGRLPPDEQARTCIFADNYGEAGALELFGARSLPPVISAHNTYHLWGPGACDGSVMIFVNSLRSDVEAVFKQVEAAGQTDCRYCMPDEDGAAILVGRQIRVPLRELWPGTRNFE